MIWLPLGILALCVLSSAAALYFLLHDENINEKKRLEQRSRIEQLERELKEKSMYAEELSAKARSEFEAKEKSLKSEVSVLSEQLASSREALKKEELARQAIEKELNELKDESQKLNKDVSLTSQMYEGLKAQYRELERLSSESSKSPDVKILKPQIKPKETFPYALE